MDISIARKPIELLYLDRCDIYEYREVVNPDDYTTETEEVLAYENVPCKLSRDKTKPSYDGVVELQYESIKLILNQEIEVKSGSRIVVTRGSKSVSYKNSGAPSRFFNHQEIMLVLEDDES
jgi:hypothetical protein